MNENFVKLISWIDDCFLNAAGCILCILYFGTLGLLMIYLSFLDIIEYYMGGT